MTFKEYILKTENTKPRRTNFSDVKAHLDAGDYLYVRTVTFGREPPGMRYAFFFQRTHHYSSIDGGKTWNRSPEYTTGSERDDNDFQRFIEEEKFTKWVPKNELWKYLL